MNYVFTFFILVISNTYDISVSFSKCQCSDISYENDCSSLNSTCNWNGTNCTTWNCIEIESLDQCTTANQCAWKNNSCDTFSKCSDYSSKDAPCNNQGAGCDQSTDESGTGEYVCIDKKTNKTKIGTCPTYRNNETCIENGIGCIWTGRSCKILDCQNYTTSEMCTRVYSENYQTVKICEWTSNETCTQASSLEVLNESNCISLTSRRATWNSEQNQCNLCSSFSFILSLTSIIWL